MKKETDAELLQSNPTTLLSDIVSETIKLLGEQSTGGMAVDDERAKAFIAKKGDELIASIRAGAFKNTKGKGKNGQARGQNREKATEGAKTPAAAASGSPGKKASNWNPHRSLRRWAAKSYRRGSGWWTPAASCKPVERSPDQSSNSWEQRKQGYGKPKRKSAGQSGAKPRHRKQKWRTASSA